MFNRQVEVIRAVVSPARQEWGLAYGGLPVAPAAYQMAHLPEGALARLGEMASAELETAAPKLLELTTGPDGEEVLAVGVDWAADSPRGRTRREFCASCEGTLARSRPRRVQPVG